MKNIFLASTFFIILLGCIVKKQAQNRVQIIKLEKTACSGPCPIYIMNIFSNGNIELEAKANMNKLGAYKSNISQDLLNELISNFDKANFFELDNEYTSLMMDLPTNYICYSKNGKAKCIKAYDKIPNELNTLIKNIDHLRITLNWEKVK